MDLCCIALPDTGLCADNLVGQGGLYLPGKLAPLTVCLKSAAVETGRCMASVAGQACKGWV